MMSRPTMWRRMMMQRRALPWRSVVKKRRRERPKAQTSWFQKRSRRQPVLTHPPQIPSQRNPRPEWRHLPMTQLKMETQRLCTIQSHHLKGEGWKLQSQPQRRVAPQTLWLSQNWKTWNMSSGLQGSIHQQALDPNWQQRNNLALAILQPNRKLRKRQRRRRLPRRLLRTSLQACMVLLSNSCPFTGCKLYISLWDNFLIFRLFFLWCNILPLHVCACADTTCHAGGASKMLLGLHVQVQINKWHDLPWNFLGFITPFRSQTMQLWISSDAVLSSLHGIWLRRRSDTSTTVPQVHFSDWYMNNHITLWQAQKMCWQDGVVKGLAVRDGNGRLRRARNWISQLIPTHT